MASLGSTAEPSGVGLTLNRAKALLQELLTHVSSPRFHKKLAAVSDTWGRRELVLGVQREVLPFYGFDSSECGFEEVAVALQPFLSDPKILELSEAITKKLMLPRNACGRDDEAPAEEAARSVLGELLVATRGRGAAERAARAEEGADSQAPPVLDSREAYTGPVSAVLEYLKSFIYPACKPES